MSETRIGNPPVVIDIGTRLTMVGFAGEDRPRFTFPTVVGYPSMDVSTDADFTAEYYIGQELFEAMPQRLVYPVKAGIIEDWNAVEAIYAYAFDLLEVTPSKTGILITENVLNPQENRKRTMQMLFHDFGVSHFCFAVRSVLPMVAIRRRTGIVIDFEPDYIFIVPVHKGLSIPQAIEILDPPTTTGLEIPFIAKQICVTIEKVDSGIHDMLRNNIVLTGSSTTTNNFETDLLEELQSTNPSWKSFKIIAKPDRLYLPWIGGSIFGKMTWFNDIGVSRAEFEQEGFDV